ncbi:MAG: dephospho-CoA kinase [Bacteroidales bacterium]|nr:dephospho-CoA kinase [Bacteroidales bacterium]
MLKIGITGGIGSGKSTVCKIFSVLGIPVFHADERAKNLIDNNRGIRNEIIREFGPDSFVNGIYNTGYISKVVFTRKEKLHKLNSIIHPFVAEDFSQWVKAYEYAKYILEEAAILFESGADQFLDYIIVVNAPLDLRIRRIMNRDGISREMVLQRMKNQFPADNILPLADWIIENDEKHLILPQILSIHDQLIS